MKDTLDVIVVGGGHAGLEAACAAAKMGAKTHLFTILIQNLALASCNPAVGGLGKGHLVKEIDALGGVMGEITDRCGLQFRTLNASKGPAVRGTRAQIDMDLYPIIAKKVALTTPNLSVSQELITDLIIEESEGRKKVLGVKSNLGKSYYAKCVILTTGTFLRGLIHIGEKQLKNGRFGELSAENLPHSFSQIGLEVGRLKTGTCARIDGRSIDFSNLEAHFGDANPPHFSARTKDFNPVQIPCYVTYTNQQTHDLIRENFHRTPLFTGQIQGVGPRYCPSIEDKVYRFSEKERHQLFLEPQTRDCLEYYINGLSTSLPTDIQEELIHTIAGLENARITRYGYAIEYDFVQPTELKHTLECKKCENLFLAGQINGTTGYEEAAALGLMAGINAVCKARGMDSFILRRDEGYIGVMIDDLVSKGTNEPYRVFTSRAEYRLLLREDNAYLRLGEYAYKYALISPQDFQKIQKDKQDIARALDFLNSTFITPTQANKQLLESLQLQPINDKTTLAQTINNATNHSLCAITKAFGLDLQTLSDEALMQICIESKYATYIAKQAESIQNMQEMLKVEIPKNFAFDNIPGLSLEVIEKLKKFTPKSLFEASQISGITPSSLDVLHLYIHLRSKNA
ncbi:tRNA uridine-5-carboxymethylaminomethyl(34) synthesis enzyme MnmG [Helicobacter sp. 10-6591]|uniref:tRNA uridine-5-carboxymethylaminomethyl(34) synthesis enzyme MnmG n=1 Tax=Helicobacter sp. 10-6591 TaxID=2004998 RepID=UPI000DCDE34B|nr:tRNA uridine-5-carboxymethylaminomethyl(34) synthesis enzyme MnmG [Helicobacter sp. 10-6591]RAX56314.1 tRNA uridine-5-carboxymethylaminomethyl(34) synthesis enzyme MnmG [Helicobacter sp. 10-6591]